LREVEYSVLERRDEYLDLRLRDVEARFVTAVHGMTPSQTVPAGSNAGGED
jgi:hypothetical protein